jgi:hypothetical protein
MRYLIALTLMAFMSIGLSAQELEAEKCNWKNVEILPYSEGLQENEVIVGSGTFLYDNIIVSIEGLTEKQLKDIKKYAPKFKSCKIYVDFEATMLDKKLNPELTDNHLHFVCVLQEKNNVL